MSGFFEGYLLDIIFSVAVLGGALILYLLQKRHFKSNTAKKVHAKVTMGLILILVLSIMLEIWHDKSDYIHKIMLYKRFFPSYDTIIMIMAAAVCFYFLQLWLLRKVVSSEVDLSKKHKIKLIAKWVSWGGFFISVFMIIVFQRGWSNIGTFLGLLGAGVALSMQESVLCLLGWFYIILSHPYDIGDRVELDGKVGDVIGITPTHTRLLEVSMDIKGGQSTGRILTVPNSMAFRSSAFNATSGFPYIWLEISTVVTFESDWEKAREILNEISLENSMQIEAEVKRHISKMQDEYAIHYQYLSPKIYTSIDAIGVNLTLRVLSPVRACRQRENDICVAILTRFSSVANIELAYPTSRIYRRNEEI